MAKVRLEVAFGAMSMLAAGTASSNFSHMGMSDDDYDLFTGSGVWQRQDQGSIESISSNIITGVMDMVGIQRIEVSAEYIAAVIAMFVHPVNYFTACSWLARNYSNEDLASGNSQLSIERVTPGVVYALVEQLQAKNPAEYLARFNKRVGLGGLADEAEAS